MTSPKSAVGAAADVGVEPALADAPAFAPARLPFALACEDAALVAAWRRLEAQATLPTQSHDFAAALADTLLAGTQVDVFVIGEGEGIAALLPLCREPGPFARWRTIGARELYEPGDALCRDATAAGLLARAMVRDGRALRLDRVPANSPLIPALRAALKGKGWMAVRPATPTPTLPLDAGWTDPLARFNAGRRSDFRRAARRAGEYGEVSFEIVAPEPGQFDALFDEAIAVEARSWKREAGSAIAVDKAKEDFFREYLRAAGERGLLRIAFMRVGGQAIAMQMALEWLGRYWLFKIGFDEKFGRCSPGTLLMLHTIGWAAGRGLGAYELLGQAEPWIAQLWTQEQHDCVEVRAYPPSLSGAAALAADGIGWLRRRLARGGS